MKQNKAPIVISVGGSLIVPEEINIYFLSELKKLIDSKVKKGERFIIITGGGKTARNYQSAGKAITKLRSSDVDWLGIHSTRLNSQLVKTILLPHTEEVVVHDPHADIVFKKPVLIAAGWKPGWSTDYDAVLLAKRFGAKKLINLSNIDYVYDHDPRTHKNAVKIEQISWKNFRALIPKKWDPGLNSPFDPVASREAEKIKLSVAIINGQKIEEIEKFLSDKEFVGTLIN
ncbi:MAG: UMP kinase [Patescibacteria group bacterium]